ncbi:VOC family protein [Providencia sp. Me31A]|uniref:VOC family protein n=1 Tax=Providencia sp. Me31A TaxID=3392637 RepID=UPI003D29375B
MKLIAIDHVHVYVDDLNEAVKWYKDILFFEVTSKFKVWFDQGGPLVINNNDVHLSLFKRTTQNIGNTIAFSVDKPTLIGFIEHLSSCNIPNSIVDHEVSISIYFTDPYENKYEITTYEHFKI